MSSILCFVFSFWSFLSSRRFKIPPKICGCSVFTLPPKTAGKFVIVSTSVTGVLSLRINSAVPPVEIIFTSCSWRSLMISSSPSLLKTEIKALLIFLFIFKFSNNFIILNLLFKFRSGWWFGSHVKKNTNDIFVFRQRICNFVYYFFGKIISLHCHKVRCLHRADS